jgi:hypothetical protein
VNTQAAALTANAKRERARLNPACIACGPRNPKGLRISFQRHSEAICADWIPTSDWESFQGTIHGGIITTVLDEAMSKAIIARQWEALTVDLRVRFRGRVSPGEGLHVRGWIIKKQRRKILAEATLTGTAGEERAHAWATFLVPPTASPSTSKARPSRGV